MIWGDYMEYRTRKRIRCVGYDYNSAGSYFISICTADRKRLLSRILLCGETAKVALTDYGRIAENQLLEMNARYKHLHVDHYVIMPDHVHIILTITDPTLCNASEDMKNSVISQFVGTFKRFTNKAYGHNIWQPRSNDHVIRNEKDYLTRWQYMDNNPLNWIITGKNGTIDI